MTSFAWGWPAVSRASTAWCWSARPSCGFGRGIPGDRDASLPVELHDIAAAALAIEPSARTASAEAFVADLKAYLAGEEATSHRFTIAERAMRSARRDTARILGAGAIFTILALGVGAWLETRARSSGQCATTTRTTS